MPGALERIDATQRVLRGRLGGAAFELRSHLVVDQCRTRAELKHEHIAVERDEIDDRAVELVAHDTTATLLLPVFERLDRALGATLDGAEASAFGAFAVRRPQGCHLALVEGIADRLAVVRDSRDEVGGEGEARAEIVDLRGDAQDVLATHPGGLVGRQSSSAADVALRGTRGEGGHRGIDAEHAHERVRHLGGGRGRELEVAAARTDRGQDVLGARGAEDPHRARRRLLDALEQGVGALAVEAVSVLEHEHVPWRTRRRHRRPVHQLARLAHGVGHRLGYDVLDVDVRGVLDGHAFRACAASALGADERRGQRERRGASPGSGRPGDQPRVRHRSRGKPCAGRRTVGRRGA